MRFYQHKGDFLCFFYTFNHNKNFARNIFLWLLCYFLFKLLHLICDLMSLFTPTKYYRSISNNTHLTIFDYYYYYFNLEIYLFLDRKKRTCFDLFAKHIHKFTFLLLLFLMIITVNIVNIIPFFQMFIAAVQKTNRFSYHFN